ncbi:MAG TPA: 23S rRNA (pseudouridine(1915)-N(3))-methyltransferase RlmH [Candidatus Absconditabacterales bacterium]|nr:23S rRNA (pseudouridine(1915)-N(3))-methyltransferase RlmH [Candidatus Absconditabacterales bacterium]
MIALLIISDGDKHFDTPIKEYLKRLGKSVFIHALKPSKKDSPGEIIKQETNYIVEFLQGKYVSYFKVLLSKDGKSFDTSGWVTLIKQSQNNSQDVVFIIGGPYGLDESSLLSLVDLQLGLGTHTMPHGLVKLIVLEQIYRSLQVLSNQSYHY